MPRTFAHAPAELTQDRLKRLGEGIGKVVYASEHWVVRRERSPREVVALIILWKMLRKRAQKLPFGWGRALVSKPSRAIRFLRILVEAVIAIVPKSVWYTKQVAKVLKTYRFQDRRGAKLARTHLAGTGLLPETIAFPPATVLVGGWPGWLVVDEATERVEDTLDRRVQSLAETGDFAGVELWLDRFLHTRETGWNQGLFSVDAHLKNFGIIGDRVVLLDTGGLTNRWEDISAKLSNDAQIDEPHVQLGLDLVFAGQPDLAQRFNQRWRALVNRDSIIDHWPQDPTR
jgi:hypothetical protein